MSNDMLRTLQYKPLIYSGNLDEINSERASEDLKVSLSIRHQNRHWKSEEGFK